MKVSVIYQDTTLSLDTSPSQTIAFLKDSISAHLHLPPSSQKLFLILPTHSLKLHDSHQISDYQSLPTCPIHLKSTPKKKLSPYKFAEGELPQWITKLVEACQTSDLDGFYQILENFERHKQGSVEVEDLEKLLNTACEGKWCCIHYAAFKGDSVMLQELLDLAADCNKVTEDYWTPLQISACQGKVDCVKALLEQPDIHINQMTYTRGSPLHLASQNNHGEIVKILLEKGCSIKLKNSEGLTAEEVAGSSEITEMISSCNNERLVRKHTFEEIGERPLAFSGEIWSTTGSVSTEKTVFVVLDVEQGRFNHYNSRSDYVDERKPRYSIPFESILEVKVFAEVYEDKYFFLVSSSNNKLKYYTSFSDMREEWTRRILDSVKFFRAIHS